MRRYSTAACDAIDCELLLPVRCLLEREDLAGQRILRIYRLHRAA